MSFRYVLLKSINSDIHQVNTTNDFQLDNNLIKRFILLEKLSTGDYILSDSGISFFNDIFNNFNNQQ